MFTKQLHRMTRYTNQGFIHKADEMTGGGDICDSEVVLPSEVVGEPSELSCCNLRQLFLPAVLKFSFRGIIKLGSCGLMY